MPYQTWEREGESSPVNALKYGQEAFKSRGRVSGYTIGKGIAGLLVCDASRLRSIV